MHKCIIFLAMNELLEKAKELPVPERVKLVEDIWDSIAAEPEGLELTQEQKEELDRRISEHERNPERAVPIEEFLKRFDAR
jgi:putative addiction module component (TIGR02574 family)